MDSNQAVEVCHRHLAQCPKMKKKNSKIQDQAQHCFHYQNMTGKVTDRNRHGHHLLRAMKERCQERVDHDCSQCLRNSETVPIDLSKFEDV